MFELLAEMNFNALFKHGRKVAYWTWNLCEISGGVNLSPPFIVLLFIGS